MTILGFSLTCFDLLTAFGYLVAKLLFWDHLQLGTAPLLIGIFFFGAMQMGALKTQVRNLPLVVEAERIDFIRQAPPLPNQTP